MRNKPLKEASPRSSSRVLSNQPKFWFEFLEVSRDNGTATGKEDTEPFEEKHTQTSGISLPGICILIDFHPGIYGRKVRPLEVQQFLKCLETFPKNLAYLLSGQKVW